MKHLKTVIYCVIFSILLPFAVSAQKNDGAVIPGDFADPSVIKVKNTYFAVGTSSEWAPHFPIFKSKDLKNWQQTGYVFDKAPDWTSGSFWAPEYYKIKNTYYIYYTARRKSDNQSYIGVATSRYPDKGFRDHGLLVAFGKEAIDAFIFNDNGQLYITFKAYGLDKRPTEILASKLSPDGLKLEGEPFSLLKDDQRKAMEGQSILKRNGYYYMFYSAGGCCGARCSYNVRVARSTKFAGPYEIYPGNPILAENEKWKCMGHGTFVEGSNNTDVYLHHAYNKEGTVFTGRQGLVSELVWNNDWPSFKAQQLAGAPVSDLHDEFTSKKIENFWQWDFRNSTPVIKQQNGELYLSGRIKQGNEAGIALTARPVSGSFEISTTVLNSNAALKGLTLYGDAHSAVGIGTENDQVVVWLVVKNKFSVLAKDPVSASSPVQLKLELNADKVCKFYYKQGENSWKQLPTEAPVSATALPQWDRSPRAGLHVKGAESQKAQFADFHLVNR